MLYLTYALLILGVLVVGAFIFRHLLKFGYLAPNFKWVVGLFGGVALGMIVFSFSLLMQLDSSFSGTSAPETNTTQRGELNF